MKSELVVALFAIGFIGALAAFFVAWSKYDEQKKQTQEEREKRWSEISRAAGLENEIERMRSREQCTAKAVLWYSDELRKRITENVQMQDKLSSLLCPTENHVWRDGVCVKCGRVWNE